jgi:hypothetical protein
VLLHGTIVAMVQERRGQGRVCHEHREVVVARREGEYQAGWPTLGILFLGHMYVECRLCDQVVD